MHRMAVQRAGSGNGVVAAQNYRAAEEGAAILRAGGNAVDAAVAAAFALGVVEPWMSGLGGVGYMLVRVPGEAPALVDFSARSPQGLRPVDYPIVGGPADSFFNWPRVRDDRNVVGPLAICAPTMAPGMECAWREYGSLPWAELLAPAVRLADEGAAVDWHTQLFISAFAADLARNPAAAAAYLTEEGVPRAAGWTVAAEQRLEFPVLRETLRAIAEHGADTMRSGPVAQALVADIAQLGGVLTLEDFAAASPRICTPGRLDVGDGSVWAPGEHSGGAALLDLLARLNEAGLPATVGPDFYGAIADAGIATLQERIAVAGAGDAADPSSCTTSFCVIDQDGMLASATLTLVSAFGSKVLSPATGVLLNNAVSWFDPQPGSPNSLMPDRPCLSNMCPVILDDGRGRTACLGAAGGRKIVPSVAQIIAAQSYAGLSLAVALEQPRIDFSRSGMVVADERLDDRTVALLKPHGKIVSVRPTLFPYHFGIVTAAEYDGVQAIGHADPGYAPSGVACG